MQYKNYKEKCKIGRATIYHDDCMNILKQTPDNYYSLALVDPPYGIGMGGGLVGNSKIDYKQFSGNDEKIPCEEYFIEVVRASKNQIIWGGNYMTAYLPPVPSWVIWDKVQPENFTMAMVEMAWTSFLSPAKLYKKRVVGADYSRIHPTQKPVALYEWLLKNYAKEGDSILDTHMGSGSIAIATNKLGFDLTAMELDKDYYNAACERVKQANNQVDMFTPQPEIKPVQEELL